MNHSMISIIVPFRESSAYIDKVFNCISDSTFKDIEIICVDDSSTDKTSDIVDGYCNADKSFRKITGFGKGAGAARNTGLEHARGKYIQFIDSDDEFSPEMLSKAYEMMESRDLDACIFGGCEFDDVTGERYFNTPILRQEFLPEEDIFSFKDIKNCFFITSGAPWNKMFRKSFLDKYHNMFMEQKFFNDMFFTYSNLLCAERVSVINEPLYFYRINNKKSLQNNKWDDISCLINVLNRIKHFTEDDQSINSENVRYSFTSFVSSILWAHIKNAPDENIHQMLLEYLIKELKSVDPHILNEYLIDDESRAIVSNDETLINRQE